VKQITNIIVRNIKGVGNHTFNHCVIPNKPTIMVASNGFGKSSLAIGFDSLKRTGISLDKAHAHKGDEALTPEILVTFDDGNTVYNLNADDQQNSIKDMFEVLVIRNSLKPEAKLQNIPGIPSRASPSLGIEDIILVKTIPDKTNFTYGFRDVQAGFGVNGKILPNISLMLSNQNFVLNLVKEDLHFERLAQVQNEARLNAFKDHANSFTGTANHIISNIDFTLLDNVLPLVNAVPVIEKLFPDEANPLLIALQVAEAFNVSEMVKIAKRYEYEKRKKQAESFIEPLVSTWKEIKPKEKPRKGLVIEFPKANQISNGERDIICLVAKLIQFSFQRIKNRTILLIDDVFDYLDDANLIAVQFYISRLIKHAKEGGNEIYPIILTHLDPMYYRTFRLKGQKVEYLEKRPTVVLKHVEKIIIHREDPRIEADLSKCFLHYHTDNCTLDNNDVIDLGLHQPISNSEDFHTFVNGEFDKYLNNQSYDPISVGIALRIRVEKIVHDLLPENKKEEFLNEHGTVKKLDLAENNNIDVHEYFYLLHTIYNGTPHLVSANYDNFTPWFTKLDNKTVKNMIHEISKM
jgi:hypothetical protein